MFGNEVHTVPWKRKWANKVTLESGHRKVFRRKRDAIREGRKVARQTRAEHFIHRPDGSIRTRDSYGNKQR